MSPPQTQPAGFAGDCVLEDLRTRVKHRFEERRGPHAVPLVAGDVNRLLECDRAIQHQPGDRRDQQGGQGKARQVLPVANPDWLGECQPLRPKRLLRELQTVQRVVVHSEAIIEGNLPLVCDTAVSDHSGDASRCFSFNRFTPRGPRLSSIQISNGWRWRPADEQS